jgi:DNA-binding transcriptional MocR family regulator
VIDRKLAFSLCSPVLPQVALADFLTSGAFDAHLRRLRRLLEENLLHLTRSVEASFTPDTRVSRPAGGFALAMISLAWWRAEPSRPAARRFALADVVQTHRDLEAMKSIGCAALPPCA